MTPAAVEERYGVPPARYPELAALVGETSDNLPGVPGVGQGFAAKWINQYDGLDNVIAHADEIPGKKGEALREHLGDVMRNRRLNALVVRPRARRRPRRTSPGPPWDRQAVHTLFDGLEFQVLRTRLLEAIPTEEDAVDESGFDVSMRVLGPGELAGWLAEHAAGGQRVGLHPVGSLAGRAPATSPRWPSRPRTARRYVDDRRDRPRRTSRRWRPGSPTRRCPR